MRRASLIPFVLSLCLGAAAVEAANPWTPIGPDGGQIQSLEADPQQAGVLYAGTMSGAFKSTNGGATWQRTSRGLKRGSISDLAVAPSDSSIVYAVGNGVFVSRDGGASWSGPILDWSYVLAVDVDPRDPRRVWIGTSAGLFWSPDGGITWAVADSDLIARVVDIAVDPFDSDTVYAAVSAMEDYGINGIVKSTDAGATWVALDEGPDASFSEDYAQLAVDPTTPGLVYASFYSYGPVPPATWRSMDRGVTWHPTEGGFPLTVDRQGGVYAGAMRSTDHGQTWQTVTMPPDLTVRYAASASGDGTVWAGTFRLGVFGSRDRAATWQPARDGLHATWVPSFAIDAEQPRVIYAAAGMAGVYKSANAGAGWRRTDTDLPPGATDFDYFAHQVLGIDPRHPRTLYLWWNSGSFARSDDGGVHWTVLRDENDAQYDVSKILVDPTASQIIYVAGQGVGAPGEPCVLTRSADRGETFQCMPPFRRAGSFAKRPFFDPARPGTLWIPEARGRFWKGTSHGERWMSIRPRGLERAGDPLSLAIDPSSGGRMFLGTAYELSNDRPDRIWRSDDGGLTWKPWGRGIPNNSRVTELLIDSRKSNILYAAVEQFADPLRPEDDASGVYWSRDGGKTFRPAGLTGRVLQLSQDPKNPRKLYASLAVRGIYSWIRP